MHVHISKFPSPYGVQVVSLISETKKAFGTVSVPLRGASCFDSCGAGHDDDYAFPSPYGVQVVSAEGSKLCKADKFPSPYGVQVVS